MFNGLTIGNSGYHTVNFDTNVESGSKPESADNSQNQQFKKIENEINELTDKLKDGSLNSASDKMEVQGTLNKEFADYLKKHPDTAQSLYKTVSELNFENITDKNVKQANEKAKNDLMTFLEPIVKGITITDSIGTISENQGNFYKKNFDAKSEINPDSINKKIAGILRSLGEKVDGEDESKDKYRTILKNINQIMEHPNPDNTKALQKFILKYLEGQEKENLLKGSFKGKNQDNPDGLFGQATLNGVDAFLVKLSKHISYIDNAKKVMDEHETAAKATANAEAKAEAEADKKRKDEEVAVDSIVDAINTNIKTEEERIDKLNIQAVFADYPLKGSRRIDREINTLKHINDVNKQVESLKTEREALNKQVNIWEGLLNSAQNRSGKRFAEKQIRTYKTQIHEINLKYNELKNQEDLKTPIKEKIRIQLNKIKEEYKDQFVKLDKKVKRLKGVDLSDFGDGLSDDAKKVISAEQENRISSHKSEIDKYNSDMDSILSFLGSKYERGGLVDDTSKTSNFEQFANKYNVDNNEKDSLDVDQLNTVIDGLKDKPVSEFGKLDVNGKFQFNEGILIEEGDIKYVKVGNNKFQLCDKNTKNITSSLVCLVSGGALYFASYKDGKVSSDGALLHSKELQKGSGSKVVELDGAKSAEGNDSTSAEGNDSTSDDTLQSNEIGGEFLEHKEEMKNLLGSIDFWKLCEWPMDGLPYLTSEIKFNKPFKGTDRKGYLDIGGYKFNKVTEGSDFTGLGYTITHNPYDNQDYIYIGNFKNGKKDGMGIMRSQSSATYLGEFKNGVKDGKGELVSHNPFSLGGNKWLYETYKYEGEFKNNLGCGIGKFTWANGATYEGNFSIINNGSEKEWFYFQKMDLGFMDNGTLTLSKNKSYIIKDGKYTKDGNEYIYDGNGKPLDFHPNFDNLDSLNV